MNKKRTALNEVLGLPTAQETHVTPPAAPSASQNLLGRRPGIVQQTAYLPDPVYEQLRKLAFDERRKIHSYLMEGLNRVFRDRGLPSLEELTGKPF